MWLAFGIAAIIIAVLHIVACVTRNRNAKWLGFISLSLTALTLCAFYSDAAALVVKEDWSALMDILPGVSKVLWVLTICSILMNSVSLFRKEK